VALNR